MAPLIWPFVVRVCRWLLSSVLALNLYLNFIIVWVYDRSLSFSLALHVIEVVVGFVSLRAYARLFSYIPNSLSLDISFGLTPCTLTVFHNKHQVDFHLRWL